MAGIILRSFLWFAYIQHAEDDKFQVYITTIYYPPFCRLDGLILGVALAMLRNFHEEIWIRMTNKSNWLIIIIATQFSILLVNDDTIYDKILNIIKSLEKPEKLLQ